MSELELSRRKSLTRDLLAGYFRNMALILYKASSDGANTVNGSERLSFSTIMSVNSERVHSQYVPWRSHASSPETSQHSAQQADDSKSGAQLGVIRPSAML